jgi:hypothetical protein
MRGRAGDPSETGPSLSVVSADLSVVSADTSDLSVVSADTSDLSVVSADTSDLSVSWPDIFKSDRHCNAGIGQLIDKVTLTRGRGHTAKGEREADR